MNNLYTKEKNFLSALRNFEKLGIFSVDENMLCLEWNAGMHSYTGITEGEVIHQSLFTKFPDLTHSIHLRNIQAALQGQKLDIRNLSLSPFSDSKKENFSFSYLPIHTDEHTITGCLVVIQETEDKTYKKQPQPIRHEMLSEISGAGIWQITPEGYTAYVNPAMCQILGVESIKNLEGKTFHSFFSKATLKRMEEEHAKRSNNISSIYEAELVRGNGEIRNLIIHGAPFFSSNGRLEGMIGTFFDITNKKLADIELKKSEERFRLFFEKTLTPTGISRGGTLLAANEALVQLFQYDSEEELIGRSVLSFLDPSHHAAVAENIKARNEGKEAPSTYELTGIKKDHSTFLFHLDLSTIELSDGPATIVALKDISAQRAADFALRQSEAKFRGIFKSSMIGIAFSNHKWKILDANDKFLEIIQYSQEEIFSDSMDWTSITPPEYLEKDQEAVEEYIQKGYISPYEKEYIRKDGKRVPVLIAAAALEDPSTGVTFVVDLTEVKQTKEEANKVAHELSTFLYMASHDLKGPLASVIGLTNVAHNDVRDPKALEYIKLIQECTLKLDRSLLNFLKIIKIKNNVLEVSPVDFNFIIEEILSLHKASFSNVEFHFENRLKTTYLSDPDLIRSILQNLVENSVKYQTRLRPPYVNITLQEDPQNLTIIVEDNGRGIDEKIKDKIFNIFYRGDISSKGSGLGLYIVKSAVEKLKGNIVVENKSDGGSVFKVVLPK